MTIINKVIFDTSAFLAIINGEVVYNVAVEHISHAYMCTVNLVKL
ncbi:MAG: hypothetical protein ACK5Z5_03370 [Neisseriaceae bacterium]